MDDIVCIYLSYLCDKMLLFVLINTLFNPTSSVTIDISKFVVPLNLNCKTLLYIKDFSDHVQNLWSNLNLYLKILQVHRNMFPYLKLVYQLSRMKFLKGRLSSLARDT